ncbi:MAG: RluA family pseudouridine synthase [Stellaceae bacterium]
MCADPPGQPEAVMIGQEAEAQRLDRALAQALPALSRSRLKGLIQAGQVVRDGTAVRDPARPVHSGQTFVVFLPDIVDSVPGPEPLPLDIRFEDAHLIVIDKPAGMVVHPAPGNPAGTLVNALLAHCGDSLAGIGGVRRPGIVHRLDKDTSGLMVAAKTECVHRALSQDFAARRVERAYVALVWGVPLPATGEISGNIGRSPSNRKKMAVVDSGGKPALTRYRVERVFAGKAAQVECRLATGRTPQIRVHLAERGHPVIGDPVYGGRAARRGAIGTRIAGFPRQALHAKLLGFIHPETGETLRFESAPPADFRELLSDLERL